MNTRSPRVNFIPAKVLKAIRTSLLAIALTFSLGINSHAADNDSILADSYPDRYTVVKGDTLWGISGKFLRDPWRWPEVWQGNPQVENPDLIYPGDVLVMTFIDGRPVLKALRRERVRLSPSPRATRFEEAVPLIDPAAISAYINAPLVTDDNEMKSAGYVVEGFNNRIILGKEDHFYARGVIDQEPTSFRIFRPGRKFIDPVSKEHLGYEAVHIGDASMRKPGQTVRMEITRGYQDINVKDRLRPIMQATALQFFTPKAPANDKLRGVILKEPNETTELGALSVVAVNLGEREGIQAGDVFRIRSQKVARKDPVTGDTYFIPEENIGVALVFRTFEKVSYVLITDSNRQVRQGDVLVSPKADINADLLEEEELARKKPKRKFFSFFKRKK